MGPLSVQDRWGPLYYSMEKQDRRLGKGFACSSFTVAIVMSAAEGQNDSNSFFLSSASSARVMRETTGANDSSIKKASKLGTLSVFYHLSNSPQILFATESRRQIPDMSIIGRIEDNDTLAVLKDDRSSGVLYYDRSGDNLSLYRLDSLNDLEEFPNSLDQNLYCYTTCQPSEQWPGTFTSGSIPTVWTDLDTDLGSTSSDRQKSSALVIEKRGQRPIVLRTQTMNDIEWRRAQVDLEFKIRKRMRDEISTRKSGNAFEPLASAIAVKRVREAYKELLTQQKTFQPKEELPVETSMWGDIQEVFESYRDELQDWPQNDFDNDLADVNGLKDSESKRREIFVAMIGAKAMSQTEGCCHIQFEGGPHLVGFNKLITACRGLQRLQLWRIRMLENPEEAMDRVNSGYTM